MRSASLNELPPPPRGKTGWPWTEESSQLQKQMPESLAWPRITVVTPSLNQGRFIEETIRSILLQGYPNLQYFVLDGGSTDNTVDIIQKYSPWISFWVSEPDRGQSAAINRGLRMGSGLYATWINSDDMLCKNALASVACKGLSGNVIYIGDCVNIDEYGNTLFTHRGRVQSFEDLVHIGSVWRCGGSIDQPAVLFPLDLALRVGGLNERAHFTMDYELWGKLFLAGAKAHYTETPFGIFRQHQGQKTRNSIRQTESLLDAVTSLVAEANSLSAEAKQKILADLESYRKAYPEQLWKHTGRLARLGFPPSIVVRLRSLRETVEKTISKFRARLKVSNDSNGCWN